MASKENRHIRPAALDVCRTLNLIKADKAVPAKELLHRIVAMLTKLAR